MRYFYCVGEKFSYKGTLNFVAFDHVMANKTKTNCDQLFLIKKCHSSILWNFKCIQEIHGAILIFIYSIYLENLNVIVDVNKVKVLFQYQIVCWKYFNNFGFLFWSFCHKKPWLFASFLFMLWLILKYVFKQQKSGKNLAK